MLAKTGFGIEVAVLVAEQPIRQDRTIVCVSLLECLLAKESTTVQ